MTTTSATVHPTASQSVGAIVVQFTRQSWAALRLLLGLTLVLGIVYPLAVTAIGQVAFPWQANGSLLTSTGQHATSVAGAGGHPVIGSALIGQGFDGPTWFQPRPSDAGKGYDTLASAGSNLGPNNPTLLKTVQALRQQVATANNVSPAAVPPDAITASGSGLDPDISPAYAQLQVARVAAARGLSADAVAKIVADNTIGRTLGILGDPRVNVLRLNLALATMAP
jgi:K+-transporting ATPase ATPase C chain